MNYELAKKLKEAGFPQCEGKDILDCPCDKSNPRVHYPTLSELIEACGRKFTEMGTCLNGDWYAEGDDATLYGKTPEEAVANLWLELNKKLST